MSSLYQTSRFMVFFFLASLTMPTALFAAEPSTLPNNKTANSHASSIYPAYPPTTAATGKKAAAIKRGEYLVKMGDCISCHTDTERNGPTFGGGLPMNTPFGTFYSPNITPDKKTGIGNWTEQDFIRALKEGINAHGQNAFPVFPFIYFANVTDDDARDMYTYFMNIPAVELENRSLPFPFNLPGARLSLWGWKMLFFFPNTPFAPDATQSDEWNRGKYIVDGLGHCSMCHTPLNPLGAAQTQFYLSGTFIDGYWAPNITKDGLKSATREEVANVFVTHELINKAGPVAGPMAEVNHNSLMYLTEEDRLAIATYLKTVVSNDPHDLAPSDKPPTLTRGKQVYRQACTICHQNGEMTAPLIGSAPSWYARLRENGLNTLYRHAIDGYNSMPVRGACVSCSDNDIISAVDYILNKSLTRSQWLDVQANRAHDTTQVRDEDAN